jgi:hypothetical protein
MFALFGSFILFASDAFATDVQRKFQNFEISDIWLIEMKFEMDI